MVELSSDPAAGAAPVLHNGEGAQPVLLVCEHASNYVPEEMQDLGLTPEVLDAHVAWDPGAAATAELLSERLDARLVTSAVSRLVYDCNRPVTALDAMPARSEVYDIPGNADLSAEERARRVQAYYDPFHALIEKTIKSFPMKPAIVTIHSFTSVYRGKARDVDIGIIHDKDSRLADLLLASAAEEFADLNLQRNQPYGPEDGVTHTLIRHGVDNSLLNVMIEVRNDLLATETQRAAMAQQLAKWIGSALGLGGTVTA